MYMLFLASCLLQQEALLRAAFVAVFEDSAVAQTSVKFCPVQQHCVAKEATTAAAHVTFDSQAAFPISMMASDGFVDSEDFAAKGHSEKRCFSARMCEDGCVKTFSAVRA